MIDGNCKMRYCRPCDLSASLCQLQRLLPEVARKVLTEQLRQLGGDGIVTGRPTRQDRTRGYDYSEFGERLQPILSDLATIGSAPRWVAHADERA